MTTQPFVRRSAITGASSTWTPAFAGVTTTPSPFAFSFPFLPSPLFLLPSPLFLFPPSPFSLRSSPFISISPFAFPLLTSPFFLSPIPHLLSPHYPLSTIHYQLSRRQPINQLRHSLPHRFIRKPSQSTADVVRHMLGVARRRSHHGDRRMTCNVLDEELRPCGGVEFLRPFRDRLASGALP